MCSPFITEPLSPVFALENSTKEFVWKIKNCGWEVRIITEEYTLYPNIDPIRVPIKSNTDYNVSITPGLCEKNIMNTSVSLSITFTENVLEYIDYIICKVFMNDEMMYKSRVNLTTRALPSTEIKMRVETMTSVSSTIMPTDSMSTVETTRVPPSTEIKMRAETTTSMSSTIALTDSTSAVEITTNSGFQLSMHFSGAFLSIIHLSFAFLSHQ